jgi:hypothetical protein
VCNEILLLLWGCPIHGIVEIIKCVAILFFEMEPENVVYYILLSNIYVAIDNRHLCEKVEWQKKEKGATK